MFFNDFYSRNGYKKELEKSYFILCVSIWIIRNVHLFMSTVVHESSCILPMIRVILALSSAVVFAYERDLNQRQSDFWMVFHSTQNYIKQFFKCIKNFDIYIYVCHVLFKYKDLNGRNYQRYVVSMPHNSYHIGYAA